MIRCGWCEASTPDADWCSACKHSWPRQPWEQRGLPVPVTDAGAGRPVADEGDIRARYAEAVAALKADGRTPTVEAIAERLDRSARTVRGWRKTYGLR